MIVLQAAREKIRALRFSPDGEALIAPSSLGAQVWHLPAGGAVAHVLPFPPAARGASSIRLTHAGKMLLLCRTQVVVTDLASREVARVPLEDPRALGHCELTPDGRFLVVAQADRLFCRRLANPSSFAWSVSASGWANQLPLFFAGGDCFVTLERGRFVTRDARTGTALAEIRSVAVESFNNPVLSPDGRLIACHKGAHLCVYRAESLGDSPMNFANDNPKELTGVAFHPDGRYLATTSNDGTVKMYETARWNVVQAFDWGIGRLRSVAFSPDGMLAAVGGEEGKIVVWDVEL